MAPGCWSVAGAVGALGAALGTMVANLSSHKRGWDERWVEFSDWADKGKAIHDELLALIDADTEAFNAIMTAFGLSRESDADAAIRDKAIQAATRRAIEIPLQVMEASLASMTVIGAMAETGIPASISDAGVGALCARTAVMGAYLNVRVNSQSLSDEVEAAGYVERGREIQEQAVAREAEILRQIEQRL